MKNKPSGKNENQNQDKGQPVLECPGWYYRRGGDLKNLKEVQ